MRNRQDKESIRTLSQKQLNNTGIELFGYAKFQKTFEALQPHNHKAMEFIVVIKGTQQYELHNQIYTLHGGDVFITFPEEIHGNGPFQQEVAEIIWFQLDFSAKKNFLCLAPPYSDFLIEQLQNYTKRVTHINQKNLQNLQKVFDLLNSEKPQHKVLGCNYLLEFLLLNFCEENISEINSGFDISSAINYINDNLTENPSIKNIAEHCGLSISKFNLYFKEKMGVTPHSYIINQKIALAKEMLTASENTITDTAYRLGFSSSDYFSTVFKKYTGLTPSEYLQK